MSFPIFDLSSISDDTAIEISEDSKSHIDPQHQTSSGHNHQVVLILRPRSIMEYTTRPETVMLEDSQHPRHNPCPTAKCSRLLEALLEDEDLHPLMFGCGHDLQQEQDAKLVPPKTARILNSPPMLVPSSRDVHIFSSGYSANKLRKKHPYYQQLIRKHYETWNKLEDRKEANGPLIDKIMEEIDNAYYYDNRNGMRRVEKSELAELIKQKMRDEKRRHNRGSKAGPSKRGDRIDPTKSIKKARIDPDELAKSVKYKEQVVSNEVAKIDQEIMTLVNSGGTKQNLVDDCLLLTHLISN